MLTLFAVTELGDSDIVSDSTGVLSSIGVVFLALVQAGILAALTKIVHTFLVAPLRRSERARLLLDIIESALKHGQPVAQTIISASQSRDTALPLEIHLLAAHLEEGASLHHALERSGKLLNPQIVGMLQAGVAVGDLRKVLPACRQMLGDAVSKLRAAVNYVLVMTFIVTPAGIGIASILKIVVFPKIFELAEGSLGENAGTIDIMAGVRFLQAYSWLLIGIQVALLAMLWIAAILYWMKPSRRLSCVDRYHFWIPWRRKRLQRDFSSILAVLLDAGMPEPEAVRLAAECTSNCVFKVRAERVVAALGRGLKLPQAMQMLDDSGEFAWRLSNAVHGKAGFLRALAGWHESLDAKAFQQEQAAAHGISTALVLWSGVYVGVIVICTFSVFVALMNVAILW